MHLIIIIELYKVCIYILILTFYESSAFTEIKASWKIRFSKWKELKYNFTETLTQFIFLNQLDFFGELLTALTGIEN